MALFKSSSEKDLDRIIRCLEMNMSNNYKDNAQDNLKEFEIKLNELRYSEKINDKIFSKYESILDSYKEKMKGYSHKDQKPYWH
ncbi:MAG: hypothetical protein K6E62_12905 [Lachnospiraceae bacterium]|nr:hypothetical protein [Lachnospiraceae bacterium]